MAPLTPWTWRCVVTPPHLRRRTRESGDARCEMRDGGKSPPRLLMMSTLFGRSRYIDFWFFLASCREFGARLGGLCAVRLVWGRSGGTGVRKVMSARCYWQSREVLLRLECDVWNGVGGVCGGGCGRERRRERGGDTAELGFLLTSLLFFLSLFFLLSLCRSRLASLPRLLTPNVDVANRKHAPS